MFHLCGVPRWVRACGAAGGAASLCEWRLSLEDDFKGAEGQLPDATKWRYQCDANNWTKDRRHNERQWYMEARRENCSLSGRGTLRIIARREDWIGGEYTSARIRTRGAPGSDFRPPVRVEVRAKLPTAHHGLWPAIWCMPSAPRFGGWPRSGELDIMEHVGFEPGVVHSTVHTGNFNWRAKSSRKVSVAVEHDAFHTYVAEWDRDRLTVRIDDREPHYVFENTGKGPADWPFDEPFHLILNLAVGGNWGGRHGIDDDAFPAVFEIEHVRIYTWDDDDGGDDTKDVPAAASSSSSSSSSFSSFSSSSSSSDHNAPQP